MLNKLSFFKKPLFQKRQWSCDFPPRKTPVAQKHRPVSRQEKMAFSIPPPPPVRMFETPLPLPQSLYGRGTSADVTTKICRIDGLPKLLSNGAPLARKRAGSAIISYSAPMGHLILRIIFKPFN